MNDVFDDYRYSLGGRSAVESDAQLAMHIVLYLSDCRDEDQGCWHGPHVGATLRQTCHVLEALHLLERHAFERMIDDGISWLVNLSDNLGDDNDDVHPLRLHPSRFKTLAWLDALDDAQVLSELAQLSRQIDDSGYLHGFMSRPLLATMTVLECFCHLNQLNRLNGALQRQARFTLDCVERQFNAWQPEVTLLGNEPLSSAGDVSYALDLLIKWDRLRATDEASAHIVPFLLEQIDSSQQSQAMSVDALYSAIQLATHFKDDKVVAGHLDRFLSGIRLHYDRANLNREPEIIHPLVLRCLLAVHGDALRANMIGSLLQNQLKMLQERNQTTNLELKRAFQTIIKRRLDVDIRNVKPLSGGITNDEVFRVEYAINLTSPYQIGDMARTQIPAPHALVIKQGSRESLNRAVQRYQRLPKSVKELFARHDSDPQLLAMDPETPAYLILEDLTDRYDTFRNMLNQADQRRMPQVQKEALHHACNTIMQGLTMIYDLTKRRDTEFVSHQLSRLYLSRLEHNAKQITQAGRYPHFRVWLRGFYLGKRRFPSLDHYLQIIERNKTRLVIPYLMLIHGDCHTRNIMLHSDYDWIKLIDLDKLEYEGDYIWDIAELIEDVAIFRFLFDDEFRFYHDRRSVNFPVSDPRNRNAIEAKIEYAPFTSALTQEFQRYMMRLLEKYAGEINDTSWKHRLWLALATHLLGLVSNHDEVEHASVIYVEAFKLLDDLTTSLQQNIPLPQIPFPGVHRKQGFGKVHEPFNQQTHQTMLRLHRGIVAIDTEIDYEVRGNGAFVRYSRSGTKWPLVILDGTKQRWKALLAAESDKLSDPFDLVESASGAGVLGAVIHISSESEQEAVLALIRQVVESSQLS